MAELSERETEVAELEGTLLALQKQVDAVENEVCMDGDVQMRVVCRGI